MVVMIHVLLCVVSLVSAQRSNDSSIETNDSCIETATVSGKDLTEKLIHLGTERGYLVKAVDQAVRDIIVVKDKQQGSQYCISRTERYELAKAKPICPNDLESYRRKCYKRCSLLTDGKFPKRVGMAACQRRGCDWETEELWDGKCIAKCSILTNGEYPRRVSARRCAKDYSCNILNYYLNCSKSAGWMFGCNGFYVAGDHTTCPSEYAETSTRISFASGMSRLKRICRPNELKLRGFCHTVVKCPVE